MRLAATALVIYGLVILAGGLSAYFEAGSLVSLISSLLLFVVLIFLTIYSLKGSLRAGYLGGVLTFLRWGDGQELIVVLNFTPVIRTPYRIGTPRPGGFVELLNSDNLRYGGSDVKNPSPVEAKPVACHGYPWSIEVLLPPLGALIFQKV